MSPVQQGIFLPAPTSSADSYCVPTAHPPTAVPNVHTDSGHQQPQTTDPIEAISHILSHAGARDLSPGPDLSSGPVGERWREKKDVASMCVYVCECAFVLLSVDALDLAVFALILLL